MIGDDAVKVDIDTRLLERGLEVKFPIYVNQQMNRSYSRFSSEFGKDFTKSRLVRGVFHPKRKMRMKKRARGQPGLPAKMRKAGFIARLTGRQRIKDKELSIRTSSPLLLIRERGGVIRPRRHKYLVIRGKRARGGGARPVVRKVRQVTVPAVLGFVRTFNRFAPTKGMKILDDGLDAAVKRTQAYIDKGKL